MNRDVWAHGSEGGELRALLWAPATPSQQKATELTLPLVLISFLLRQGSLYLTHFVAMGDLELLILLPLFPKRWDNRYVQSDPVYGVL